MKQLPGRPRGKALKCLKVAAKPLVSINKYTPNYTMDFMLPFGNEFTYLKTSTF